jgi:hypothetical protein
MQMQVNAKMIPVETTPGTDGGGEGEYLRSWIHIWYIWFIVRIAVNVIMYPLYPAQQ